ncbi:MAG: hypothetical protein AAFU85_17655 [Planctomycetota bacterium]
MFGKKTRIRPSRDGRRTRLSAQTLESRQLMAGDVGLDTGFSFHVTKFDVVQSELAAEVASIGQTPRGIQLNPQFDLDLNLNLDLDLDFVAANPIEIDLSAISASNFAFDTQTFVGDGIFATGTASATGPNAVAFVSIDTFGSGVSVSGFASAGTGSFSLTPPSISVSTSSTTVSNRTSSFSIVSNIDRDFTFDIDVADSTLVDQAVLDQALLEFSLEGR